MSSSRKGLAALVLAVGLYGCGEGQGSGRHTLVIPELRVQVQATERARELLMQAEERVAVRVVYTDVRGPSVKADNGRRLMQRREVCDPGDLVTLPAGEVHVERLSGLSVEHIAVQVNVYSARESIPYNAIRAQCVEVMLADLAGEPIQVELRAPSE